MKLSSNSARRGVRMAGAVAVATAGIGLLSQGAASADTFVKLPGQTDVQTLSDGTKVTVTRSGETATLSPGMSSTPLLRNATVSGKYQVKVSDKKAKGKIQAGYLVGCQVNLLSAGESGADAATPTSSGDITLKPTSTTSISLGPGQVYSYYLTDVESADAFGADSHASKFSFSGGEGSFTYINSTIQINGCAGYAQARSFATIKVSTSSTDQVVTVWGKPFSIG
ncbi:hypothetical protein GCM10027169_35670 [Gordonia jinhuaensis]|uniref:MspA protein n=1 Tax=Gordonia jinhuaensis TaxID=1517702 RepID=A0A916T439_9ACTN|nr:MspA family porin [Gordonia jinhuaensis]GGB29783.1 hypothetical protein GCM10011489_17460 [Gordonia jinhuaensis]